MHEYRCIHCGHPTQTLFKVYRDRANTSLVACSSCDAVAADPYVATERSLMLVDLVLSRASLYRHLTFNCPPAQRLRQSLKVNATVLALDALVRFLKELRETPVGVYATTRAQAALFARMLAFASIGQLLPLSMCVLPQDSLLRGCECTEMLSLVAAVVCSAWLVNLVSPLSRKPFPCVCSRLCLRTG